MAEEKSIPLIIEVDGSKAIKTVGELKKGISDTRAELEKTEIGSKRFDELSTSVKQAEGRMKELQSQSTFLKDMPGPIGAIAKGFDSVKTMVMSGVRSFGALRLALAATGIGLLLVAFGALQSYFTKTEKGAQQLRVIMAFFGATVDAVMESMYALIRASQAFLSGDFSKAGKEAASAFSGVGKRISESATAAITLERAMNAVKVASRELSVETAKARSEIKDLNKVAEDTSKGIKEREIAAQKAGEMEAALMKKRTALAEENLRIIRERNALATSSEEEIQAEADAEIELYAIRQESLELQTTIQNKLNTIKQQQAMQDAAAREEEKKRNQDRVAELEAEAELRFRLAEKSAENDAKIAEFLADARAKSEEDRLELEIQRALESEELKFTAIIKAMGEQNATIDQMEEARMASDAERLAIETRLRAEFDEKKLARIAEEAAKEQDLRRQIRESQDAINGETEESEQEANAEKFQARMEQIIGESELERELRDSLLDEQLKSEQDIRDKYAKIAADKKKKADEDQLKKEEDLRNRKVAVAQSLASALGSIQSMITGQSKEAIVARKILAVAQIAIDTAIAVSGAIAAAQAAGPFPANIAAIAVGVAAVISGIASAVTTLNTANVGGGSAAAPSAPPVPSAPTFSPVSTNTTQLGNTEQAELAPIQAFVVETELTNSQNNINQIESQATFGGG